MSARQQSAAQKRVEAAICARLEEAFSAPPHSVRPSEIAAEVVAAFAPCQTADPEFYQAFLLSAATCLVAKLCNMPSNKWPKLPSA